MDDYLEDELLELAGEGEDKEEEDKPEMASPSPPRNIGRGSRSPASVSSPKKRSRAPPKRSRKKARRESESSAEEGEESESLSDEGSYADSGLSEGEEQRSRDQSPASDGSDYDIKTLYPLEGKFKDYEDRQRLLAMNELERESIISERLKEVEEANFERTLHNMVKSRGKIAADSQRRTSKRTKSAPKKSQEATKRDQLDKLKRTREERKAMGGSSRVGDEDTGKRLLDDEDDGGFDDYVKEEEREITLDDINRCRIGRTGLAKLCDYPGFENVMQDVFVRIALPSGGKENVYRMCQVIAVEKGKPYSMLDEKRRTDQYLKCSHGKAQKQFLMDQLSDAKFTEAEFNRWKKQLEVDRMSLPGLSLVQRKTTEIRNLDSKVLTPAELEAMLFRRNAGKHDAVRFIMDRSRYRREYETARIDGNEAEMERLRALLQELEDAVPQSNVRTVARGESQMERMARINAVNRKKNNEEIRRAEIEERRRNRVHARDGTTNQPANPFQRVKTVVKFRHDNNPKKEDDENKDEDMRKEVKKEINGVGVMAADAAIPIGRRKGGVDDIIAAMDIEIEI